MGQILRNWGAASRSVDPLDPYDPEPLEKAFSDSDDLLFVNEFRASEKHERASMQMIRGALYSD